MSAKNRIHKGIARLRKNQTQAVIEAYEVKTAILQTYEARGVESDDVVALRARVRALRVLLQNRGLL